MLGEYAELGVISGTLSGLDKEISLLQVLCKYIACHVKYIYLECKIYIYIYIYMMYI